MYIPDEAASKSPAQEGSCIKIKKSSVKMNTALALAIH